MDACVRCVKLCERLHGSTKPNRIQLTSGDQLPGQSHMDPADATRRGPAGRRPENPAARPSPREEGVGQHGAGEELRPPWRRRADRQRWLGQSGQRNRGHRQKQGYLRMQWCQDHTRGRPANWVGGRFPFRRQTKPSSRFDPWHAVPGASILIFVASKCATGVKLLGCNKNGWVVQVPGQRNRDMFLIAKRYPHWFVWLPPIPEWG